MLEVIDIPRIDNSIWGPIRNFWMAGQTGLPEVIRWGPYLDREDVEIREQDSLQHSYSITILSRIYCLEMRSFIPLDEMLITDGVLVHDGGEGELKRDVLYRDKTTQGDLDEYQAFIKTLDNMNANLMEHFQRAFLLQFALKDHECFPEDAQAVMADLAAHKHLECLSFDAIERWDYVMYALEQYIEHQDVELLVQVLRNQMPKLNRLADQDLTGFGEVIWTKEIREKFESLLEIYEGQWIEPKGK